MKAAAIAAVCLVLMSVHGTADPDRVTWSLPLPLGLQEEAVYVPADNPLTPAKIELGRQLFFDPRLSCIDAERGAFKNWSCVAATDWRSSNPCAPTLRPVKYR
jgi:hypothetical protein